MLLQPIYTYIVVTRMLLMFVVVWMYTALRYTIFTVQTMLSLVAQY